jgi:hypothetical protein
MAWDSVPWAVGGGAQHSPEVARLVAYAAMRGNEGISAPLDLQVKALAVPGGSVTIDPGACSILTRSTGGSQQMYVGRLASQDSIAIPATGGSARSDLIVARVEDPYMAGEPWTDPSDPTVGPYIFTRRIASVPSTQTDVVSLNLGYSAIPLARVDIPASTGTITSAMIHDLRTVANPRRVRGLVTVPIGSVYQQTATSYATWPTPASWSIPVPSWATSVKIVAQWAQIFCAGGASGPYGNLEAVMGSITFNSTSYDTSSTGGGYRTTFVLGDTQPVPAAMRGTNQTITLQARKTGGTGFVQADTASALVVDYEFNEVASNA